ncbi:MAG: acetylpolyamine aminohydrolase [Desulfobacterales bacterium S7086C20]|nr:MAG: acetylpolyamine aminohydrolase [Desulfobacterales bacterium S7086C20]
MKVIFHEDFYQVYASDPAAASGRMEAVMEVITPHVDFIEAEPASSSDIAAVHTEPHVERVKQQGVYDVAALAAGGAIQAATLGLEEPCFGLIRPPGHHASSDSAWGFCYFNNMAIAIEHLKAKNKIQSAYVLDIDLHFGDGTVNIFKGKDYVTVYNVASGHREDYMAEVKEEMGHCQADIIGISAGFDNHEDDWGGTLLTEDYRDIGEIVRAAAEQIGGGCFALLEGGYNHQVLGRNVLALIEGLSGR